MFGWPAAAQIPRRLKQVLVDQRGDRPGVPDGRHAADGEAGRGAHEVGIGLLSGSPTSAPTLASSTRLAPLVTTSSGRLEVAQTEHEGLADLVDAAADRAGGVGGRARRETQIHDLVAQTQRLQGFLHALHGRAGELRHAQLVRRPRARRPASAAGARCRDRRCGWRTAGARSGRRSSRRQPLARRRRAARAGTPASRPALARRPRASAAKAIHAVIALPRPRLGAEGDERRLRPRARCDAGAAGTARSRRAAGAP